MCRKLRFTYLDFIIEVFLKHPQLGMETPIVNRFEQTRALVDGVRGSQGNARPYSVSHGLYANCCQEIVHSGGSLRCNTFMTIGSELGKAVSFSNPKEVRA